MAANFHIVDDLFSDSEPGNSDSTLNSEDLRQVDKLVQDLRNEKKTTGNQDNASNNPQTQKKTESRFAKMTEADLAELANESVSKNTHYQTLWAVRTFRGNTY